MTTPRQHKRNASKHCASSALFAIGAAASLSLSASRACAGDITDSLPQTAAARDSLRTWDDAKQNGAATVNDHSRRAYLPDGVRIGTFMASPTLTTSTTFDDNLYTTARNRESDLRIDIEPNIEFNANLPRHELKFGFGGRMSRYLDHTELNHENAHGHISGALHINAANLLFAKYASAYTHLDPLFSTNAEPISELTPLWTNQAAIGYVRDAGRLHGSLVAAAERFDFSDITARDGSLIDHDKYDFTKYSGVLTAKYRFSPGYTGVAKARYIRQQSDIDSPDISNLDFNAWEFLSGISAEISPVLRANLLAGYAMRNYDNNTEANPSNTLLEASLEWLPTQLMTVKATARHGFIDAPAQFENASFDNLQSVQTSLGLKVDYEILRNLTVNVNGNYRRYEQQTTDRSSDIYTARVGLDYYHVKNWFFSLAYEHQIRQSSYSDEDITRNRVWALARLQF